MSKLEELEKELYAREDDTLAKRMKRRVSFLGTLKKPPTSWLGKDGNEKKGGWFGGHQLAKFFVMGLSVFLIIAIALVVFLYLGTRGQEIKLTVDGSDEVEAGEFITIPISYQNVSRTAIKNVELTLILPPHSTIRDENGFETPAPDRITRKIDDLSPGEQGRRQFVVRLFGHEGETKTIETDMLYRPENLQARFLTKTTKSLTIGVVPLAVSWEIPDTLSHGQEVDMKVHYISNATLSFQDLAFRMEYPPGFDFVSADPKPDIGNAIWKIGALDSGQEGIITIHGTINGEEGESKGFKAGIGTFDEATKEWIPYSESGKEVSIAVTPIAVQGFIGGAREHTIRSGERLSFSVRYKNNTQFTLHNVTVRTVLTGDILAYDSLDINGGGVFDFGSHSIVWGPGNTEALREIPAGGTGELTFTSNTRPRPVIKTAADKNLTLTLDSHISVGDKPQELSGTELTSEDILQFKVKSKVLFTGRAIYYASSIPNVGPLPPRVGKKTTYSIIWDVRNFSNDLENVEVRAKLPPNIQWENMFSPPSASLQFDQNSSEVRWHIGELKAGGGVLSPATTVAFKISSTPSEADLGKFITLLNAPILTGTDSFVNEDISETTDAIDTRLQNDPSSSSLEWSVAR